jgi:large conductance mechanosensitive channel
MATPMTVIVLNTVASVARLGSIALDKMDKATEKKKGFVKEFVDFLQTFGVIGLAIGFVIGVASSAVVNSLVKDLINPIVGLLLPTGNLASLNATVTSPVSNKPSVFLYGDFISQVIYFIIIALVVFLMYKQLKRLGLAKM